MKEKLIIFIFLFLAVGLFIQTFAQFKPGEIAEREKWEEFLKTSKKISSSQPYSEREAVTEPWVLALEKDGVTARAMWKDVKGLMKGYIEGWRWEIAAYRLDKLLGLNMVPPTVEKRFKGDRGSCQLVIEKSINLRQKEAQRIKTPSYRIFPLNKATYLQRAWDNLIFNEDRNIGDILYSQDWRMILIDHSRSFRTSGKSTKTLLFSEKSKPVPKPMRMLPKTFVEKLKSVNFNMIKNAVGEYLTDKEIEAVMMRRDLLISWLEKRIKELGEDEVLY